MYAQKHIVTAVTRPNLTVCSGSDSYHSNLHGPEPKADQGFFYSRSTLNLDPPLYATVTCTVLKTENSTVQVTVAYRGGSGLNVDLEQKRSLEMGVVRHGHVTTVATLKRNNK